MAPFGPLQVVFAWDRVLLHLKESLCLKELHSGFKHPTRDICLQVVPVLDRCSCLPPLSNGEEAKCGFQSSVTKRKPRKELQCPEKNTRAPERIPESRNRLDSYNSSTQDRGALNASSSGCPEFPICGTRPFSLLLARIIVVSNFQSSCCLL